MLPLLGATDQVTVALVVLLQASFAVAVNCCCAPTTRLTVAGEMVTEAVGPTVMVTLALPLLPEALAVTPEVTLPGVQLAVSTPPEVMVPAAPVADQVKV